MFKSIFFNRIVQFIFLALCQCFYFLFYLTVVFFIFIRKRIIGSTLFCDEVDFKIICNRKSSLWYIEICHQLLVGQCAVSLCEIQIVWCIHQSDYRKCILIEEGVEVIIRTADSDLCTYREYFRKRSSTFCQHFLIIGRHSAFYKLELVDFLVFFIGMDSCHIGGCTTFRNNIHIFRTFCYFNIFQFFNGLYVIFIKAIIGINLDVSESICIIIFVDRCTHDGRT